MLSMILLCHVYCIQLRSYIRTYVSVASNMDRTRNEVESNKYCRAHMHQGNHIRSYGIHETAAVC